MKCYFFPGKTKCPICKKKMKEDTEGKKGYCQGHSILEVELSKKQIKDLQREVDRVRKK